LSRLCSQCSHLAKMIQECDKKTFIIDDDLDMCEFFKRVIFNEKNSHTKNFKYLVPKLCDMTYTRSGAKCKNNTSNKNERKIKHLVNMWHGNNGIVT
jgi:hypothetical protein